MSQSSANEINIVIDNAGTIDVSKPARCSIVVGEQEVSCVDINQVNEDVCVVTQKDVSVSVSCAPSIESDVITVNQEGSINAISVDPSTFIDVNSFSGVVVGPQGPQGNDGTLGATGAPGATGEEGPQGPAGPDGATGPEGPRGATGIQGNRGPEGARGNDGLIGPKGATGERGIQGEPGLAGDPSYVRLSLSSAVTTGGGSEHTISNTVVGKIPFNTEDDTNGSEISSNTSLRRLIVASSGLYRMTVNISVKGSGGTSQRSTVRSVFKVNDAEVAGESFGYVRNHTTSDEASVNMTRVLRLSEDDYVEVFAVDESLNADSAAFSTVDQGIFELEKIGAGIKGDDGATGADSTVPGPTGPAGVTGAGVTGARGATGPTGPDFTYTNGTEMPEAVGGFNTGTTFSSVSLQSMFDGLLYPYQQPSFSSFSVPFSTQDIEVGSTLNINGNYTWAFSNASNVEPNTLDIKRGTSLNSLNVEMVNNTSTTSPYSASGFNNLSFNTAQAQHFKVFAEDINGNNISRSRSVNWRYRVYWGTSSSETLDESGIEGLANNSLKSNITGDYDFAAGDYKYFAWPTAMGSPTAVIGFRDKGTGSQVAMVEETHNEDYDQNHNGYYYDLVDVTNSNSLTISYRVYRSKNVLGSAIEIEVS